jgi:signal peptidase I
VAHTRQRGTAGSLIELVTIVAVALGLALAIQAFVVKPYRIPSASMVPTLEISQRVLVDRITMHFSDPGRGDIVVFKPPLGADTDQCGVSPPPPQEACPKPTAERSKSNFIKRVVGLPGDHLKVIAGRVWINGKQLNEPYIRPPGPDCQNCDLPREITVPPGDFFMMGDNRGESDDSRTWGPVPKKWIIGKAFFTYWPPRRIGTL